MSRGLTVVANALRHPLGRRRPALTLLRIAWWQALTRLRHGPHDVAWLGETRLLVERGMTGATGNVYFGLHEVPDMAFVLHFLRPGEVFFDIGANIGSYALLAARIAEARVVAFEPHPRTAEHLARNVAHNRLVGRVEIRRVGLSARAGQGALTDALDTMNHVVAADDPQGLAISLSTLDEEAASQPPVLLKIDVEGHEEQVLAGGSATLAAPTTQAIEIETVTPRIAELIARAGLVERFYDPFTRQLHETAVPGLPAANRLYLRDPAAAQARVAAAPPLRVGSLRM